MFRRVACAISGGVDSAVAAHLLLERGYNVTGVFMHNWDATDEIGTTCESQVDFSYAKKVADHLRIPLVKLDLVKPFWHDVFAPAVNSYVCGQSPNPDVLCNRFVKFDHFFQYCTATLNCHAIATGHYALSSHGSYLEKFHRSKKVDLLRPKDLHKDQTYFLCQIPQFALAKTMFPLAELLKSDVRRLASEAGMHWLCNKAESVGICMVGPRKFASFIDQYVDGEPGQLVDIDTLEVIGNHQGFHKYTLGQRLGIGGLARAYYVVHINPATSRILVCSYNFHPAMYSRALVTCQPYWINEPPRAYPKVLYLKTRHPSRGQFCTVNSPSTNGMRVELHSPMRCVSPGQYAVFYDGNTCLGGAAVQYTESLFERYGRIIGSNEK